MLDRVVHGPQVAEVKLQSAGSLGRPPLTARLLLAPLSSKETALPRLLGCLQSHGTLGRAPRRFSVTDVHMRRIVAAAEPPLPTIVEQHDAHVFDDELTGFAEPQAVFVSMSDMPGDNPQSRVRPHLRLVKTD